jgi:hypothetical protein
MLPFFRKKKGQTSSPPASKNYYNWFDHRCLSSILEANTHAGNHCRTSAARLIEFCQFLQETDKDKNNPKNPAESPPSV